jgi:ParB family chromosome partitioning protein
MKLYYQLVSVTDIKSSLSASQFSTEEIEKAANLFLEAELSIQPIVLKQHGLEDYSVIYGDFIYFAAVRAREIDPRTAETIQAVVVEPENESALLEQVELFKHDSNNTPTNSDDLTSRFNNFEQIIDQRITDLMNQITQENKELKSSMKAVEEQIPKRHNLLDLFKASSPQEQKQLRDRLKQAGVQIERYKVIEQILEKQPFNSLEEIPKAIKGLSPERMLKVIENWLNHIELK